MMTLAWLDQWDYLTLLAVDAEHRNQRAWRVELAIALACQLEMNDTHPPMYFVRRWDWLP